MMMIGNAKWKNLVENAVRHGSLEVPDHSDGRNDHRVYEGNGDRESVWRSMN